MLLIVLLLCVIVSVLVAVRRRDSLSFYLLGMSLSNCIMLAGIIVYIAQIGGIPSRQTSLFFLTKSIQDYLRYLPIHMDKLGYVVALGRTLFPLFTLWVALDSCMISSVRQQLGRACKIAGIPTILLLIYYFPAICRKLTEGRFGLMIGMMKISLGYTLTYLILAVILMLLEQFATTISFYRRKNGHLILSVVGIGLLYCIYATKDPTQIYQYYISEYLQYGVSSYIGPALSGTGWAIVGIMSLCFVILGSYGMICYMRMEYDEEQQDLFFERRFDTAGNGVTVFIHGIKNQLLTSRVLHKKLDRELGESDPDIEVIRGIALQLRELNEGMLDRIHELNQSLKNNALILVPVPIMQIVESAVVRFREKYPDISVKIVGDSERRVLADLPHLAEAVYNLLINGYEAAIQRGSSDPNVCIILGQERLWTVLEIRDNGIGVPADQRNRIFEPFYTSKNVSTNWGMGLYYTRRIVKSHFGKLRLESSPGKGTSIFVMLPRYDTGREKE